MNTKLFLYPLITALVLTGTLAIVKNSHLLSIVANADRSFADSSQTLTFTASSGFNEDGSTKESINDKGWFGTGQNPTQSYVGLRFENITVPAGATITNARLKFMPASTQWIGQANAISAENGTNPTSFSSSNPPSARSLTSSSVSYQDNVQWVVGTEYSSPNITSVINGVISSGNTQNLNIIMRGTSSGSWGRKFFSFQAEQRPKLQLTVSTSGSTAQTPSPTVTAKPTASATVKPSGTNTSKASLIPNAAPTVAPDPTTQPTTTPTHHSGGGIVSVPSGASHALGMWTPNTKYDTCTQAQHDAYSVVGPDGKRYPTWHPPTGPGGCTFGHEHGRDPNGSALLSSVTQQYNGVLFGYANEKLDEYNISKGVSNGMRHEDHVGHKIEWENNVRMSRSSDGAPSSESNDFARVYLDVYCDFFMKVHQGTHSKDAFANNLHELTYAVQCRDGQGGSIGTRIISSKMVAFGKPGGFSAGTNAGGFIFQTVGSFTPPNSPTGFGPGRTIPTIDRVKEHILKPNGQWSLYSEGIYEDWISSNYLRAPSRTKEVAYFDPHFAVFSPSRFFWSGSDSNTYGIARTSQDKADNMGRSVDLCYMTENNGSEKYRGGACDDQTNYGKNTSRIAWDDPRSQFNGVVREFYFNNTGINNQGGPTTWYSDPFGNDMRSTPATGYIKHYLAPVTNERRNSQGFIDPNGTAFAFESNAIGGKRFYGGNGVHAPN